MCIRTIVPGSSGVFLIFQLFPARSFQVSATPPAGGGGGGGGGVFNNDTIVTVATLADNIRIVCLILIINFLFGQSALISLPNVYSTCEYPL